MRKVPLSGAVACDDHAPLAWLQLSRIDTRPSVPSDIVYFAGSSGLTTPVASSGERNSNSRHFEPAKTTGWLV